MSESIAQTKAEAFAVKIVSFTRIVAHRQQEWDMTRQAKRSGTSIGANITEALFGSSIKDFINKFQIALKECNETLYWLRVMNKCGDITDEEFSPIYQDCFELSKIIAAIINTAKKNMQEHSDTPF